MGQSPPEAKGEDRENRKGIEQKMKKDREKGRVKEENRKRDIEKE